jgi:hypothetical protein
MGATWNRSDRMRFWLKRSEQSEPLGTCYKAEKSSGLDETVQPERAVRSLALPINVLGLGEAALAFARAASPNYQKVEQDARLLRPRMANRSNHPNPTPALKSTDSLSAQRIQDVDLVWKDPWKRLRLLTLEMFRGILSLAASSTEVGLARIVL